MHSLGLLSRTAECRRAQTRKEQPDDNQPSCAAGEFLTCPRYVFHSVPAHDQYDQPEYETADNSFDPDAAGFDTVIAEALGLGDCARVLTSVHLSPGSPAVLLAVNNCRPFDRLLCVVSSISSMKPCPFQKSLLFAFLP
jgi:hypothetical protein